MTTTNPITRFNGTPPGSSPASGAHRGPAPVSKSGTPEKLTRRPSVTALGIALMAAGALVALWVFNVNSKTHQVVVAAGNITQGSLITRTDLTTAAGTNDPATSTIPGSQIESLVGKYAAVTRTKGDLITPASITEALVPAPGQSVVGIALKPAQMPGETLVAGETVQLVDTPVEQADPPTGVPNAVTATVVQVHPHNDTGITVVDVSVSSTAATTLAAHAATGRLALVLNTQAH